MTSPLISLVSSLFHFSLILVSALSRRIDSTESAYRKEAKANRLHSVCARELAVINDKRRAPPRSRGTAFKLE
jgi:hypothetical protein